MKRTVFRKIEKTISPISGNEVKKHTVSDVIDFLKQQESGKKAMVLSPIHGFEKYGIQRQLELLRDQGYVRLFLDESSILIEDVIGNAPNNIEEAYLMIDRIKIDLSLIHI